MSLYIWIPDEALRTEFKQHTLNRRKTDSGFDLLSPETMLDFTKTNLGVEFRLGVHIAALDSAGNPAPYLLLARSSTSLTPFRMSNQIGLADMGYRGELIARVDCLDGAIQQSRIQQGKRLFQVVQHNWLPWTSIHFVDSFYDLPPPPDNRGAAGFGSTGV